MEAWLLEKEKCVNVCRTALGLCGSGGEQHRLSSRGVSRHLQISSAIPLFFKAQMSIYDPVEKTESISIP